MQARMGFTSAFRRHGRLGTGCLAIAFALSAAFATSASAHEGKNHYLNSYLALGDSLAFGYSQELYNLHEAQGDPAADFNQGYAQIYFKRLDKTQTIEGKPYVRPVYEENLACPGETTASFIGQGEEAPFMEALGASTEPACPYQETFSAHGIDGEGGPLHLPYAGESQLRQALKRIYEDEAKDEPLKAVTIDLGGNDELHLKNECASAPEGLLLCLQARAPHLIEQVTTNMVDIVYTLRNGSLLGWSNYSGPITFIATYDPFGTVKGSRSTEEAESPFPANCAAEHDCIPDGEEYLYDSNLLTGELTSHEKAAFEEKDLDVCFVNLQEVFNPASTATPETSLSELTKLRNEEAFHLKKWTNMVNRTVTEGKADGPDIHPTKAGYLKITRTIVKDVKECKEG